jgi:ankyrin repeat protein
MLRVFLKKGASFNAFDESRATPLLAAASTGRLEVVEALLAAGARPDFANRNGFTPLHAAAASGRAEVVERLLRAGVPPDVRSRWGSTPLMHARGIAVTKALLKAGADPNAMGSMVTPLIAAAGRRPRHEEAGDPLEWTNDPDAPARMRALLAAGAHVDGADLEEGSTALMIAAGAAGKSGPYLEALQLLLEAGADPNRRSRWGGSALRAATSEYLRDFTRPDEACTLEAVRLLLEAGAKDQPDADRRTLLEEARARGATKLVELLRSRRGWPRAGPRPGAP